MLRSWVLIARRTFVREKAYALINIVGLALAIASGIVLSVYIRSELTYDQHHVNNARIFRVVNEFTSSGKTDRFAASSMALGPLVLRQFPDLGTYVRFRPTGRTVFRVGDTEIYWEDVLMADVNVFDVFTHRAIFGDLAAALQDPSAIAISESFSKRYFGDRNPVGETIVTDTFDFHVTAVFADLPDNTHLKYSALLSMKRLESFGFSDDRVTPQQVFNVGIYTYFLLNAGLTQQNLNDSLTAFYDQQLASFASQIQLAGRFDTQPLTAIHFDTGWSYDQPTGNIFYVYAFMAVAAFVLLIACINYTNLATARATKRAREIGMRKVIGAERPQLIAQFLAESLTYAVVALILGFALVVLAERLTPLNLLLGKAHLLEAMLQPGVLLSAIAATVVIGLAAGAYPALYLSSIPPLSAITMTQQGRRPGVRLREALVFIQFLVTVGVLASTLMMGVQMRYVHDKPLGFNDANKISVRLTGVDAVEKIPVIRNELVKNSSVLGFVETSYVPGDPVPINLMRVENNDGVMESTGLHHIAVGRDFVEVMGIEIIAGRDFSKRLLTDVGTGVVVNETLVQMMGWENPIGKRIDFGDSRVIGVMKDFHFTSLHEPVTPMFLQPFPPDNFANVPPLQRNLISRTIVVSVTGDHLFQTINDIDAVVSRVDPKHPFEFRFFDDLLNELYADESHLMALTGALAGICIFISCMGLFGLAAFTTEQRTREIGIRKVLGATTTQIILMLTRNLLLMVVIAAGLGSIVSWLVMTEWLQAFAYRADMEVWVFIVASATVAAVSFTTVALQSAGTARANPVDALRYE